MSKTGNTAFGMASSSAGILNGVRVIEFAGIGPAPFAGMMLADQGADVIRIERHGAEAFGDPRFDLLNRGKRSIALDLKNEADCESAYALIESADVLIEGYRPGVMERLGFSPEECLRRQPRLVYGRVTGWGQEGPLAKAPGHDINYLALSGALHAIGQRDMPVPPLNLVADFGGGAMLLLHGIGLALLNVARGGEGQVVDAAMIDGVASMMAMVYSFRAMGLWNNARESNLLDGGSPKYRNYQCSDGRWIAVGALEPKFWQVLLDTLELDATALGDTSDPAQWPVQHAALSEAFNCRTRDEWMRAFEGLETCIAPVLDLDEAVSHPHNAGRETYLPFTGSAGAYQPGVAPRFSGFAASTPGRPCLPGEHTAEVLNELKHGK